MKLQVGKPQGVDVNAELVSKYKLKKDKKPITRQKTYGDLKSLGSGEKVLLATKLFRCKNRFLMGLPFLRMFYRHFLRRFLKIRW